jgi:hypothetical protein
MVVIQLLGQIVSELNEGRTGSGVERVSFDVESHDEGSLPLHFTVVAFGSIGKRLLSEVRPGDTVNCFGRLSSGGAAKRVSLCLSGFELVLQGVPADVAA